jgi:hypothetical protein
MPEPAPDPHPISNLVEIRLPPSAAHLLESMRALGYSFEAALADLIDNSVYAEARNVEVHVSPYERGFVAVLDDGWGMLPDELTDAMRHGSRDPRNARNPRDLGRFGLGLKTASLSQCRRLTVVSLKNGHMSARRWDLDHVAQRQDWMLLQLQDEEIGKLPMTPELQSQHQGTLVLWEHFDLLTADGTPLDRALGNRIDAARDHLALVFHRFLTAPPGKRPVAIRINRNPLLTIDPFLTGHKATQVLPVEKFVIEDDPVTVTPYILPHFSKLSAADLALTGGEDGLRRSQGFYIYRNLRLISWGSWFRLVRQEELTKLARVQVDISNRLDHLWQLDIKKSSTYPPESLRDGLRKIINRITEGSRRVYTYRGRKTPDQTVHAWDRTVEREGVAYRINRDHPLILALQSALSPERAPLLTGLLRLLEDTLPFDALYADMASELRPSTLDVVDNENEHVLLSLASNILRCLGRDTPEGQRFLAALPTTEPFCGSPEVVQGILRNLSL